MIPPFLLVDNGPFDRLARVEHPDFHGLAGRHALVVDTGGPNGVGRYPKEPQAVRSGARAFCPGQDSLGATEIG